MQKHFKANLIVIVSIHNGISIAHLYCTQLHLSALYNIIRITLNVGKNFHECFLCDIAYLHYFLLQLQPQLAIGSYW